MVAVSEPNREVAEEVAKLEELGRCNGICFCRTGAKELDSGLIISIMDKEGITLLYLLHQNGKGVPNLHIYMNKAFYRLISGVDEKTARSFFDQFLPKKSNGSPQLPSESASSPTSALVHI
ncbi:hypothetical protein C4572_03190 [Candidatus Parcubacteria bacterium]|nr:MAG: hypothetical protein C4572_03190 [Candidatus Parcubacteria bacterium]